MEACGYFFCLQIPLLIVVYSAASLIRALLNAWVNNDAPKMLLPRAFIVFDVDTKDFFAYYVPCFAYMFKKNCMVGMGSTKAFISPSSQAPELLSIKLGVAVRVVGCSFMISIFILDGSLSRIFCFLWFIMRRVPPKCGPFALACNPGRQLAESSQSIEKQLLLKKWSKMHTGMNE